MWSSGVSMSVTARKVLGPRGWVTLAAFMMENFTSAEVRSSPSWNFTPWRSLKVMDLPSGETSQGFGEARLRLQLGVVLQQAVVDLRRHHPDGTGRGRGTRRGSAARVARSSPACRPAAGRSRRWRDRGRRATRRPSRRMCVGSISWNSSLFVDGQAPRRMMTRIGMRAGSTLGFSLSRSRIARNSGSGSMHARGLRMVRAWPRIGVRIAQVRCSVGRISRRRNPTSSPHIKP